MLYSHQLGKIVSKQDSQKTHIDRKIRSLLRHCFVWQRLCLQTLPTVCDKCELHLNWSYLAQIWNVSTIRTTILSCTLCIQWIARYMCCKSSLASSCFITCILRSTSCARGAKLWIVTSSKRPKLIRLRILNVVSSPMCLTPFGESSCPKTKRNSVNSGKSCMTYWGSKFFSWQKIDCVTRSLHMSYTLCVNSDRAKVIIKVKSGDSDNRLAARLLSSWMQYTLSLGNGCVWVQQCRKPSTYAWRDCKFKQSSVRFVVVFLRDVMIRSCPAIESLSTIHNSAWDHMMTRPGTPTRQSTRNFHHALIDSSINQANTTAENLTYLESWNFLISEPSIFWKIQLSQPWKGVGETP